MLSSSCLTRHRPFTRVRTSPGPLRPQRAVVRPTASGGFGKSTKKQTKPKKETNLVQELRQLAAEESGSEGAAAAAGRRSKDADPPGFPTDWVDTKFKASEFEIGKTNKPLILASGKSIMLYRLRDKVFCSDANSTAFQYPLIDAKVTEDSKGIYVEVPLDGTIYNLQTGAVVTWCPKDTPVRNVLGTLKGSAQPQPLPVYPVHITKDGNIFIKLLR